MGAPVPEPAVTVVEGKTYITLDTSTGVVKDGEMTEEKCVPLTRICAEDWEYVFADIIFCSHLHSRVGLIHLNSGKPGAELSSDLAKLNKDFLIVELAEGEAELHGAVQMAVCKGVFLGFGRPLQRDRVAQCLTYPTHTSGTVAIISGSLVAVRAAVASLKELDSELLDHRIQIYHLGKVFSIPFLPGEWWSHAFILNNFLVYRRAGPITTRSSSLPSCQRDRSSTRYALLSASLDIAGNDTIARYISCCSLS